MKNKTNFKGGNYDVCHAFAHRSSNGYKTGQNRNESIYFIDDDLYSYGHHYIMARQLSNGMYLTNADSYSNTTAKHMNNMYSAISHKDSFAVNHFFTLQDKAVDRNKAHAANLQDKESELKELAVKQKRARVADYSYSINAAIKYIETYIDTFNVPKSVSSKFIYLLSESADLIQAIGAKQQAKLDKDRAKDKATFKRHLKEWRNDLKQWPPTNPVSPNEAYLKVNADRQAIETSKGVYIDFEEAKRVYAFYNKTKAWRKNGESFRIDDRFFLDEIQANGTMIAGCHTIKGNEIVAIAKQMNW